MNADHLKPDKYMKNDKDQFEELKVRGACPAPPSVWAHACGESHLNGEITHIWGIMHTWGFTHASDHLGAGPRPRTMALYTALDT